MSADDLKQAWQSQSSQPRLTIDTELLLKEVRQKQHQFTAIIFWRDAREIGISLLMIPVWIVMGISLKLPWAWYLMIPGILWIAGFLLIDRLRQGRKFSDPAGSLRQRVQSSLAQVDHQIWLLRNVNWWYQLPIALPMLAFFGQIVWDQRATGWEAVAAGAIFLLIVAIFMIGIYWLNQYAVRTDLQPRRKELELLLDSLQDEPPPANS